MGTFFSLLFFVSIPVFYVLGAWAFFRAVARSLNRKPAGIVVENTMDKPTHSPKVLPQNNDVYESELTLPSHIGGLTNLVGLGMALVYTLAVSWQGWPSGLQVTLVTGAFVIGMVALTLTRGLARSWQWYGLMAVYLGLGGYAAITTNPLLDTLNRVTLLGMTGLWLLFLSSGQFPKHIREVVQNLQVFLQALFLHVVWERFWKQLFSLPAFPRKRGPTFSQPQWLGVVITLPILVVFHVLFAQANAEYGQFVNEVFREIWEFLEYIWSLDIIEIIIKTVLGSMLFTWLLSPRLDQGKVILTPAQRQVFIILEEVVVASAALFGLFSFFQGKLLFLDFGKLSFKELSTYVIHGFWELVAAALLGYIISVVTLNYLKKAELLSPTVAAANRLKWWLTLFTTELLLVIGFTLHKLYVHQLWFGFKDQRILATGAVILIFLTFGLFLLKIWRSWSDERVFSIQLWSFFAMTLFFNVMTIDLFISRHNPISYYVDGQKYKDYSYLLGNSYDNYEVWPELAHEALAQKPPQPIEYYYGWYPSLCQKSVEVGPYSAYRSDRHNRPSISYLQTKYAYLEAKYGVDTERSLEERAKFNWREYQAYLTLQSDRELFERVMSEMCGSEEG